MKLTRIVKLVYRLKAERDVWRRIAVQQEQECAELRECCKEHLAAQIAAEERAAELDMYLAELRAPGTTPQQMVYTNVKARGYLDGHTTPVLLARQTCKLGEELGELAEHIHLGDDGQQPLWVNFLINSGQVCRAAFDSARDWPHVQVRDMAAVKQELADAQVVLNVAGELASTLEAQPFDLQTAAVAKSGADVARGKRNGVGGGA